MNKRTLGRLLLCLLPVTLCAGADTRKGLGAEPSVPAVGELRYEEPKYLAGAIYSADTKQLLFKFQRVATRSGSTLKVERDFTYPDGRPAARERVVYEGDALSSYALEETQSGGVGSARIRRAPDDDPSGGKIEFEYIPKPGSRPKVRAETLQANTLIADMVGPFLASHWEALRRGEKLKCRYIVVPRAETVGFTFVRDSATQQGREVLVVRMEPSSRFLAALVAPLFFTLEQAPPHRVLRYAGRTTPKIRAGGKWKDLDAVTVFDWGSAR